MAYCQNYMKTSLKARVQIPRIHVKAEEASVMLALRKQRQTHPWSSQASQPGETDETQVQ